MSPFFALLVGRRQIKDHHLQVVTCQRSNLLGAGGSFGRWKSFRGLGSRGRYDEIGMASSGGRGRRDIRGIGAEILDLHTVCGLELAVRKGIGANQEQRGHTELRLLRRRSDERQEDQAEAARQ